MRKFMLSIFAVLAIAGCGGHAGLAPVPHATTTPHASATTALRDEIELFRHVSRSEVRPPLHRRPHRSSPPSTCTSSTWRSSLTPDEVFIVGHESGGNSAARNPSSGAFGLGQLLPQTYAAVGAPVSGAPCVQLAAMRRYARLRYGGMAGAVRFWQANGWY